MKDFNDWDDKFEDEIDHLQGWQNIRLYLIDRLKKF